MDSLVIHKNWVLHLHEDGEELTVKQVGTAVQVEDFTEIHIKDKYFFKKAVERSEEER
jgi:hypothetical protein